MCTLLLILLLLGIGVLWIEARHRLRPSSPLQLRPHDWKVLHTPKSIVVEGWLTITNPHQRMEVMVPELCVEPTLLGNNDLSFVNVQTKITPHHPDEDSRPDGYWAAYIVKGHALAQKQEEFFHMHQFLF